MDFDALANSFWFVVSAYIAAFLPWTAIASTDFISSKWISVRRTRAAGYRNLIWTLLPLFYVIFYSAVQGKAKEYTEMCAAAVAAVLAALLGIRTIWGLWQLHLFHSWARTSIEALRAVGIEYSLPRFTQRRKPNASTAARMESSSLADEILVSDKIIDNQISHGDVQCFIKFGRITLMQSDDSEPLPMLNNRALQTIQDVFLALLEPLKMIMPWMLIPAAIAVEFVLVLIGRRKPRKLRMVPKEPVEVWVHWAAAFAAQGLQKWMAEFEVAIDPKTVPYFRTKRGMERFHELGKYFGAQLLASAAFQLWTEQGDMQGVSPLLWLQWDKDSHMSDGLIVKQELFQEAIRNGKCLPFGAPQPTALGMMDTDSYHLYYTYDAYQDVLGEFVSELPVRSCFAKEMRKFNVDMLEWLTVLLHLGHCALENEWGRKRGKAVLHGAVPSSEKQNHLSTSEEESRSQEASALTDSNAVRRGVEAEKNLCSQLGLNVKRSSASSSDVQEPSALQSGGSILHIAPILQSASFIVSENNRLVTKAGQLTDVWLSLVCGDRIWFLAEKLNGDWKSICRGRVETNEEVCEVHGNWDLREAHKQLEKRSLEHRISNEKGRRYLYLDHYATFMGYRMESVRTVLGRWVDSSGGKSVDDLFLAVRSGRLKYEGIEIQLSESIGWMMNGSNPQEILKRRGAQCRLLWELQNDLETVLFSFHDGIRMEEVEKMGLAAMMLLLLSFPGLRVEVLGSKNHSAERNHDWIAIDMSCFGCAGNNTSQLKTKWAGQIVSPEESEHPLHVARVVIRVMCGPQEVSLNLDVDSSCNCTLNIIQGDREDFKWNWWRDAFLGRLDGFREWQRDLGICPVNLTTAYREGDELNLSEIDKTLDTKAKIWTEWPPFRSQFCRFELEQEHLLKQPRTVGHKDVEDIRTGFSFSRIQLQAIQPVSYAEAHDRILRDACILVQESMKRWGPEQISDGEPLRKLEGTSVVMRPVSKDLDDYEESRLLMLHQIDALHSEKAESLKECVRILCGHADSQANISEAIELLRSYMGTILSSSSLEVTQGREAEVDEVILPICEELIGRCTGCDRQIESLHDVLEICLGIDPVAHCDVVTRLIYQMLGFCADTDSELFLLENSAVNMQYIERRKERATDSSGCKCDEGSNVPGGFQKGFSRENYHKSVSALEMVITLVGQSEDGRNTEHNSKRFISDFGWLLRRRPRSEPCSFSARDSTRRREIQTLAIRSLAFLLRHGAEGVPIDIKRAAQLLETAVKKVNDPRAMFDLAEILLLEAREVQSDPKRAVELYERAIREGNDANYAYMNRLGVVLEAGEGGVPVDNERAMRLYEKGIKEGKNVQSMVNLANLLVREAEGVPLDVPRAVELYERAIREDCDSRAMVGMASLLRRGADGVRADAKRAVVLLERAIRECNDIVAMNDLALILEVGAEDVPEDARRAAELYECAIRKGNTTAMSNLATMLSEGAKDVPPDPSRAVALYERSIEEGDNVYAMQKLGYLLESGAEGVPPDVKRSMRLYERAIRKGNHAPAMNCLATLLEKGAEGIEPDPGRAMGILERAIREGQDEGAMNNLGVLLVNGADGVPINAKRAVELFERAIQEKNLCNAKYNLGSVLENGADGVAPDPRRAVKLYEEAIREGNHSDAIYNLGLLLRNGAEGVPPDKQRAVRLFETLVQQESHVNSMYELAYLLEEGGDGIPLDPARAFKLYERAVKEGAHVSSMNNMGLMLRDGAEGVPRNAPRAMKLFESAIQEGNGMEAKLNLGILLEDGAEGVAPNVVRAAELFESAIQDDDYALAKIELGRLLEVGADGVAQNTQRAVELYESAMEQGNVSAMYRLSHYILVSNSEAGVEDARRALVILKRAMDAETKVDWVFPLAGAFLIRVPFVEEAVETAKDMIRRAMRAAEVLQDEKTFRNLWEGLKYGRFRLMEDRELALEFERYAEEHDIELFEEGTQSEAPSNGSDTEPERSGGSSEDSNCPEQQ